jgi:hypothetical protein
MNKGARIHIRTTQERKSKVERIAARRGTTVTGLVEEHFSELIRMEEEPRTDEDHGVEQV